MTRALSSLVLNAASFAVAAVLFLLLVQAAYQLVVLTAFQPHAPLAQRLAAAAAHMDLRLVPTTLAGGSFVGALAWANAALGRPKR